MLNKYSVIYLALAALAAILAVAGAAAGAGAGRRHSPQLPPETRHRLEQRLHLAFTLIGIGLLCKIALLPAWFGLLHGLIAEIPGAICLTGVHQAGAPLSWAAGLLKIIAPACYGAWLIITLIDRRIATQPFLRLRSSLLIPIAVLALVESAADTGFFITIEPVPVSCCVSLVSTGGMQPPAEESFFASPRTITIIAATLALIFIMLLRVAPMAKTAAALLPVPGLLLPVSAMIAFQARLAPLPGSSLFINNPAHHCLFCTLQNSPISIISLLLLTVAATLAIALFIVFLRGQSAISARELTRLTTTHRQWAMACAIAGILLLHAGN